jgi:hypothetical protein
MVRYDHDHEHSIGFISYCTELSFVLSTDLLVNRASFIRRI